MREAFFLFTFGTLAVLFPVANPIGAVPIFYSLTSENTPEYRLEQIRKTTLCVIAVLVVFLFFGKSILILFGISL